MFASPAHRSPSIIFGEFSPPKNLFDILVQFKTEKNVANTIKKIKFLDHIGEYILRHGF